MSITKLKNLGHWAVPPTNTSTQSRPLTGRVIFGMLTGDEGPDATSDVLTSATKKDQRR